VNVEEEEEEEYGEAGGGGDRTVRDRRVLQTLVSRGRRFAARQTRRIVHKDGSYNIASENVTQRRRRYLADLFTTLVDMRWRYAVAMFGAAFLLSWTTFALAWFGVAYAHGDVRHGADDNDDWRPCVSNVYDFPTALLFSIETQTTIGYGSVHRILPQEHFLCTCWFLAERTIGRAFGTMSRLPSTDPTSNVVRIQSSVLPQYTSRTDSLTDRQTDRQMG